MQHFNFSLLLYFRFDARGHGLPAATHHADDMILGKRAHFMNKHHSQILSFSKVKADDESTYICRVDFMDKKTQYTRVNLTVIGKS